MTNWKIKLIEIITSLLGVVMTLELSPKFKTTFKLNDSFYRQSLVVLGLTSAVYFFNHIARVDHRMFRENRINFTVNRVISTFAGWLLINIVLALTANILAGRVVVVTAVIADILAAMLCFWIVSPLINSINTIVYVGPVQEAMNQFNTKKFKLIVRPKLPINTLEIPISERNAFAWIISRNVGECLGAEEVIGAIGSKMMSVSVFKHRYQGRSSVDNIKNEWWETETTLNNPSLILFKKSVDIIFGLLGAIFLLPTLLALKIIFLCGDKGPLIYSQTRIGQYGKTFKIYKIRSMTVDAEKDGVKLADVADRRVTRLGRFLRSTRLDELPQVYNVLKGEMSIVGPRPERPEIAKSINAVVPKFNARLLAKPGITGWAQVNLPYAQSIDEMIDKLEYDIFYVQNASITFEFGIILRTVLAMLKGAR